MTGAGPRLVEAFEVASHFRTHARADAGCLSRALGVASLVIDYGGDEHAVVAALLLPAADADVGAIGRLAPRFGPRVAEVLEACGDDHRAGRPHATQAQDDAGAWRDARRHRLLRLDASDDGVLLVAACDALHRVRLWVEALETPEVGPDAFRDVPGGRALALRDAHAMAQLCLQRGVPPARALDRAVDRLHLLARTPMREGLDD